MPVINGKHEKNVEHDGYLKENKSVFLINKSESYLIIIAGIKNYPQQMQNRSIQLKKILRNLCICILLCMTS